MTVRRLKTRTQFQAVLANAPVAKTVHFALHRAALDGASGAVPLFVLGAPSIGVVLPKRWARRAVTRNTIRRQIYALPNDLCAPLPSLPQAAWVVRLRAAFDRELFPSATSTPLKNAVRAELLALWQRALSREARHAG